LHSRGSVAVHAPSDSSLPICPGRQTRNFSNSVHFPFGFVIVLGISMTFILSLTTVFWSPIIGIFGKLVQYLLGIDSIAIGYMHIHFPRRTPAELSAFARSL
jgi:hypothetical protein